MNCNKRLAIVFALLTAGSIAGCGGGGSSGTGSGPPPITYKAAGGVAQKGPLQQGSTVTAQELDASLSPTGKQYSYQISSNLGTFSPTSIFGSQYIGLDATGYYFDEVANAVSGGTITLNGYSDLGATSVLNVNLLTTLTYQRIRNLVTKSNMGFTAARAQAEAEVLTAFHIPNPGSYSSTFNTLDISKGTDEDHILAAISSLFVYGNTSGNLSGLIASVQSDIGTNGAITDAATQATLAASAKALNPSAIAGNLTQEYMSAGAMFSATDIGNWIDQDGDGLVSKYKFQVPDATPTSSFTFPSFVTNPIAGSSISASAGKLSVNGTPVSGSVTINSGDVVAISPTSGLFPNGALSIYLLSGSNKIGRVTFTSGLTSIAVTPANPSLPIGLTQSFMATGTFSDTSTADLTASVQWRSNEPAIATVNATSGAVSAIALGQAAITATSGTISGSTSVSVTPVALESIAFTPNPLTTGVGIPRQLSAIGTYSDSSTADVTSSASWASSPASVVSVTGGLVSGVSLGSGRITATVGLISGSTAVMVTTNTWVAGGSIPSSDLDESAVLLANGKVFIAGGRGLIIGSVIPFSALYDPVLNTALGSANMSTARASHTATVLANGKVLVAGGTDGILSLSSAELFDPVANTWTSAGNMAYHRAGHTATLLPNGRVLVVGGTFPTSIGVPSAVTELYDPVANTWTSAGSMITLRGAGLTTTLLASGKVLVTGGGDPNGCGDLATAEIYDPSSNAWSLTGSLAQARDHHVATLLPDGNVMIAGGFSGCPYLPGPIIASAELFNPTTNTWSSAGSMSIERVSFTASLLPSGKVLIAGGLSPHPPSSLSSAELYDPSTNTWGAAARMIDAVGRSGQTAIRLPFGSVLLVGGSEGSGSYALTTTELYW
jgi:hypothetical protein